MGTIIFNGVSSADLGLVIQAPPVYNIPKRNYEVTHIPGRNGDVVIDTGSYDNVDRTYNIATVFKKDEKFIDKTVSINEWLHSAKGYARLEDSYDPDVYRLAMYDENNSYTNIYNQVTATLITFNCKPQRYYLSGDVYQNIPYDSSTTTLNLTLRNETMYNAHPEIKVKTSTTNNIEIRINGVLYFTIERFDSVVDLIIDCENMECYHIVSEGEYANDNNKVTLNNKSFPILSPGNNIVNITNSSEGYIKPRWWSL